MCVQQIVMFYSYNSLSCREIKSCDNVCLKVLSNEMDLAEIRLILKVFIKGRGAEIFSEFRPLLSL
jgi:hypothetical protein